MISLIAAMSKNRVIGRDNDLPWKIPEDLKRFKKITTGHPIIMGRKTFESIGRVLPGRRNIVVSRDRTLEIPGAEVFHSLDDAVKTVSDNEEAFVIGGGEIYKQALPLAKKLYLTLVDQEIAGDTFFPDWDVTQFQKLSEEASESEIPCRFLEFEKISNE